MKENYEWAESLGIRFGRLFDFTKRSSIGCGGVAPIAFYPKDRKELKKILSCFEKERLEYLTLGNLTNVLPPDEGVDKPLLFLTEMQAIECFGNRIFAEAGVRSGKLLNAVREAGLSGAEFLVGIPCTLGGALYMNAGAGGRYISEIVESVTVYHEGKVYDLPVAECEYAYKSSLFMREKFAILGATLCLQESSEATVRAEIARWLERRAHLPKGKSMGCVFKNPQGMSAGELIDKSGLKGFRIGGAVVAKAHANFIINDKKGTANEIRSLIGVIKNAVFAQYKIALEEEIRYLE